MSRAPAEVNAKNYARKEGWRRWVRPAPLGGLLEVRKRVQSPPQRDAFGVGLVRVLALAKIVSFCRRNCELHSLEYLVKNWSSVEYLRGWIGHAKFQSTIRQKSSARRSRTRPKKSCNHAI